MTKPVWVRRRPTATTAIQYVSLAHQQAVLDFVTEHRKVVYGVFASMDVIILTTSAGRQQVHPGDWVVDAGHGDFEVVPDRLFSEQFDVLMAPLP